MGIYYVNSAMLDVARKKWAIIINIPKKVYLINDQISPLSYSPHNESHLEKTL